MPPKTKTIPLTEIYKQVTSRLRSATLRQAYLDHSYLNRLQDDTAHIIIRSPHLAQLLRQRKIDLGVAFQDHFQRPISIKFYRQKGGE